MSSVLDSAKLIKSIRRRGFIPRSQETFTEEDFLEMATEEVNIGIMEQLIDARGDYLVYYVDVPMIPNKTQYPIPSRAQGDKLRDVMVIAQKNDVTDQPEVVYELSQISLEEISDYVGSYSYNGNRSYFYLQNNMVCIPNNVVAPSYSLRMYYYMRPNKLVINNRAGTIAEINQSVEVDNINPISGSISGIALGGIVTTMSPHGLTTGQKVNISGSNSTPSIDGTQVITYVSDTEFSVDVNVTVVGNSGSFVAALDVDIVSFSMIPTNFTTDILYDLVQSESPTKIIDFDLEPNSINTTLRTLSFPRGIFDSSNIGDYITEQGETIVPNIPTEYHPILAQRVAVACLEAMGDEQNKQSAERKLSQMERAALKMITNRVEGAPKKIKQRFGTLNSNWFRRYKRW